MPREPLVPERDVQPSPSRSLASNIPPTTTTTNTTRIPPHIPPSASPPPSPLLPLLPLPPQHHFRSRSPSPSRSASRSRLNARKTPSGAGISHHDQPSRFRRRILRSL